MQINVYDTYNNHPVDRLYRQGVSMNINTDARTITNITLQKEYEKLTGTFGWTIYDFMQCNINALRAAFITEDLKAALIKKLTDNYAPMRE